MNYEDDEPRLPMVYQDEPPYLPNHPLSEEDLTSELDSPEGWEDIFMRKEDIPVSLIRYLFTYDPLTGILRWRNVVQAGPNRCKKLGGKKGSLVGRKFPKAKIRGVQIYLSNVVWAWNTGRWPETRLHFRDKNPLNVRIENLYETGRKNIVIPPLPVAPLRGNVSAEPSLRRPDRDELSASMENKDYDQTTAE